MAEVELKLAATPGDMAQLKQTSLRLGGDGDATYRKSFETYYDTAGDRLRREGILLRICEQNHRHVQRVSAKNVRNVTPLVRCEWEDVIENERPNPRAPNSGAHLPVGVAETELRARFTILLRRTLFTLKPDVSTQVEGALDEGEIRAADGKRSEPISDIELLLKSGDPAALYRVGLKLLETAPLRIEICSKAERGYHLLDGVMDRPQPNCRPSNLKPGFRSRRVCGESVGNACQQGFSVRRRRSPT